ncbi:CLUMA_CG015270, isoform A [Clunio marinus]|uniref:CLUMA_CG015270, isoform A n=1 Tax=Clunio marinus TaxID=568069 RepID=A0A1J1IQR7_9DIPT|nr:CLUMA_CG015270, isoform A [Clunio marinus]
MNSFDTSDAEFQRQSQFVSTSVQKIYQNVSSMNRMVNQVGTAQETPEIRQQLHQIRSYTQQLIKDTDTSMREIVNCKDRHLKIQRDRLVDEFTAALTAFQAVQKKTVELEKNAMRQAKAANVSIPKPPGSNKSTNNSYPESSSGFENNFIDSKSPTQAQMQDEVDLQALEEQERTIRELEENIVGVNEIYKKLGALVYEQGNTIDSIEASVENTSVFVQEGTEQLRRANHYSTQARKKKIILALVLGGILAVILLMIFWRS